MGKKKEKQIEQYSHSDKERANNPHVGLVTPQSDPDRGEKKTYKFDPHLDPELTWDPQKERDDALSAFQELEKTIQSHSNKINEISKKFGEDAKDIIKELKAQHEDMIKLLKEAKSIHEPKLKWAGKAEHTSFEVPTVSIHVHERIDPKTIIETVRKNKKDGDQLGFFSEKKPLREAIDFYKHKEGWSNRMIAGDSLLIMNSLIEKEGLAGKLQMMYFDPPYGIKYGSNFQPFISKRKVDEKDEDLTAEPEMIKAFRDTWELGIHSYLTSIRDRLRLTHELLSDTGSVFVQINDDNLHLIKSILDEIFGKENCINIIPFKKRASYLSRFGKGLFELFDYIIWYAKDADNATINTLYKPSIKEELLKGEYKYIDTESGGYRRIKDKEIHQSDLDLSKVFRTHSASKKSKDPGYDDDLSINGEKLSPPSGHEWKSDKNGMQNLISMNRLRAGSSSRPYKIYYTDFPYSTLNNLWDDTLAEQNPIYAVQTDELPIERCMLLCSHPGDLVMDITCGSGTTAFVAEKMGRRWITCDTSRVSLALAKIRLMTSEYDYYQLAYPKEGISSGFLYNKAKRINLEILAEKRNPIEINLYDKPKIVSSKSRITGPFTIEAVPAPYAAKSFDDLDGVSGEDTSITRSGETLRQGELRDELLKTGVRGKNGQKIEFSRVEPLAGSKFIQAEAETKQSKVGADYVNEVDDWTPQKVLIVFGPEHAPLEQRVVENAWQEARTLNPDILLFCAFQFDEEAAKDIDELTPEVAGMQLLKAQMNNDLLTGDLKKSRSSNESFWLVGQPDIKIHKKDSGEVQVEVLGFDYYNTKSGQVESGGKKKIAMWMLDTDYDNRSIYPSQVFFPMAGKKDGWSKLAKNLNGEIDEEKIESFRGTLSLAFEPGELIAVKIIDDRGIESLRVMKVED